MIHRAMQDQKAGERSNIIATLNDNKKEIVRRDLGTRALQQKYNVGYESAGYNAPLPQGVSRDEYVRFAEEILNEDMAKNQIPQVAEVLEETPAKVQKSQSNFDIITALDRL